MNRSQHVQQATASLGKATPAARPCGLGRRLLAMLYDAVAVVALLMAATALALAVGFRDLNAARDPLFALYLGAVWFAYLGWCWHRGGMTLGMRAWRIHIATADGGLPGWGRCLARFLAALLSAGLLGLGFLYALFNRDRRCWHDRITGTWLLRVAPGPPV